MPTIAELSEIAEARRLPFFAGLELAAQAGQLSCGLVYDHDCSVPAWILFDSSRRCAQARKLDGSHWRIGDTAAKAKTLRGSQASWPIGASDIGAKPIVAFCEGGPDFLAAWSLAWWHGNAASTAPVCMPGSHPIEREALPHFRDKVIVIFPHRDDAGSRAFETWAKQLTDAGAKSVRRHDVAPFKDLNEALSAEFAEMETAE